jgi:hypothetical protein
MCRALRRDSARVASLFALVAAPFALNSKSNACVLTQYFGSWS